MSTNSEVADAVKVLTKALKDDKDFYYGYQSNIAMAFYDEFRRFSDKVGRNTLHKISNNAAKNFLSMWILEDKD